MHRTFFSSPGKVLHDLVNTILIQIVLLYKSSEHLVDFPMKYGEKAIKDVQLETWGNPSQGQDYEIHIAYQEFTCLCPRSGYPDFATMSITYIPTKKIVELKSLKLYMNSFRNTYISHEEATNTIYSALMKKLKPKFLEVTGDFNPRGNVKTLIRVCSDTVSNAKRSRR